MRQAIGRRRRIDKRQGRKSIWWINRLELAQGWILAPPLPDERTKGFDLFAVLSF
jgi:hypothetical protein